MSKRLTTSAIVATLLMAATSFYSVAHQSSDETAVSSASTTQLMGG
ncbi:hypothetical protein [Parasphingorhabdus sp.]